MVHIQFSLGDDDRERLGAPEWLDVDTAKLSIDDCVLIQETLGMDVVDFLEGFPRNALTIKGFVWIGLKNAGVETDLATLTFMPYQGTSRVAEDTNVGKDGSTPPPESATT